MDTLHLGPSHTVHLGIETLDGEEYIVGAYYAADDLVQHVKSTPGAPDPAKLWLIRGRWISTPENRALVTSLATAELQSTPCLSREIEISPHSQAPQPSADAGYTPPADHVRLCDLASYLRNKWEKFVPDQIGVESRIREFWKKLTAAIERGYFDREAQRIIDERGSPITSLRLRDLQEEARGVFDTPAALGRYVAEGTVPPGAICEWATENGYEVPPHWAASLTASERHDEEVSDPRKERWIREAIERIGPRQTNKAAEGYQLIKEYLLRSKRTSWLWKTRSSLNGT